MESHPDVCVCRGLYLADFIMGEISHLVLPHTEPLSKSYDVFQTASNDSLQSWTEFKISEICVKLNVISTCINILMFSTLSRQSFISSEDVKLK